MGRRNCPKTGLGHPCRALTPPMITLGPRAAAGLRGQRNHQPPMTELLANRLWEAALGQLQIQVPRPTFDTWLKETVGLTIDEDRLVVGAPTAFAAEWLGKRMPTLIEETVEHVARRPLEVQFLVHQPQPLEPWQSPLEATASAAARPPVGAPSGTDRRQATALCSRFTFDSFVVGKSNELAHAAAQAAATQPVGVYNPLFIYAGVGLGKTHLLHAIGHAAVHRDLSCLYVSAEQFTNDFISAIRERTTPDFRARYRGVQLLVIDDIQFLGGKEQTQEVFFHTFNDLHNAGKQIVIAADRPPRSLATLHARLNSRFEGGLIADIQPPDLETRLAILRAKATLAHVRVDGEVLEFIARTVQTNVRELEGSLNRVVALAQLTRSPITTELAGRALADLLLARRLTTPHPEHILAVVAEYCQVPASSITGPSRDRKTVAARHLCMYLLREDAEMSLQQIGGLLGGRNHATVVHGIRKVTQTMASSHDMREAILTLREAVHTDLRKSA